MTQGAGAGRTGSVEIAPLAERMTFLQALRVAFAVLVLGASLLVSDVVGAQFRDLLIGTAGYVLLSGTMEDRKSVV